MIRQRAARYLALFTLVAATGALFVSPTAMASPAPARAVPNASALAARSADSVVAARPTYLHAGPDDAFVRHSVISSAGTRYVAYERTYRNLPVTGGDFVLAINGAGQVTSASVAQKQAISGLSVTPRLNQRTAEKVARGQLATVSQVGGSHLVVYALGGAPRLAWESLVDGRNSHDISRLSVDVDALTGAVLHTREQIADGTGTAAYNGPNPVTIATTLTAGHYYLTDPGTSNLGCQDSVNNLTFNNLTDIWGNGDAANKETACVDALFAAQTETRMLAQWLGRNGLDGAGGAWPIRIGVDIVNAYYDPVSPQLQIGHNDAGQWISSLDIIGHENGHGIDDHTPGGISGGGTQEFVADAFGAATEWFANEPAPFDTPDFQIGELANLKGNGALRYMYNPSLVGDPNCFSNSTPGDEVHRAAGPGDHWFYLLAEGSNPNDGQPVSPTCNGSVPNGIGIQNATKILYNAMLMKTSASSYPNYRLWTLQAAWNLFPGRCTEFDAVRNAWNSVSVPAQPGEPICDLNIDIPPTQTSQLGVPADLHFHFTATGGVQPYTWAATNLPPGLAINSSTGQVTGTPTTAGSFNPLVFVTDNSNPHMTASPITFTWNVTANSLVPNVSGRTVGQAALVLGASGLVVGTVQYVPDPFCNNLNKVVSQDPSPGTVVPMGTAVNLNVGQKVGACP